MVITCKCGEELTFFSNDGTDIEIKLEATNGNIEIINDVKAEFINGNDEVTTSINTSTQQVLISNKTFFITPIVTENTADNVNYSTATVIDGICSRDCVGQDRTDQLPTATSIVAAIKNCQVGTTFSFILRNTGTDKILTLGNALGGITLSDNVNIAPGTTKRFTFMITDVDTPTIISYSTNNSTITAVTFTNTHSLKLTASNQKYEDSPPVGFPLLRPGSGAGGTDAWSVSCWYKGLQSTDAGDGAIWAASVDAAHGMSIAHNGVGGDVDRLKFYVGDLTVGFISLETPSDVITPEVWMHILVTYDGGTTGGQDSDATIKSRFKIFVNTVSQTLTISKAGVGWSGAFAPTEFGVGNVWGFHTPLPGQHIDELAVFDLDVQQRVSTIYNGGEPADLTDTQGLTPPVHWWRWTDVDSANALADHVGSYDLTGSNLDTATNILADVPPTTYTNTHSLKTTHEDDKYEGTIPAGFPLLRPGNGAGASDAWSVSFWYKGPTNNGGQIWGAQKNSLFGIGMHHGASSENLIIFIVNLATSDILLIKTPDNTITENVWFHTLVTYDGGVTGGPGITFSECAAHFKILYNGVSQTLVGSVSGNGWVGAFDPTTFGMGRINNISGEAGVNAFVDELAIFDYDAESVVSAIYNGGEPADLADTPGLTPPVHWWRWTDSDTGASVADHISNFNLTGTGMDTATNIVEDVPP